GFLREHDGQRMLCLFNLTGTELSTALPQAYAGGARLLKGTGFTAELDEAQPQTARLVLPPYQAAFLALD
ncbi:alpha-glucosidase, partial [Cobetia marina]